MNLNKPQSEMRQVYNCIRDAMLRANQRNDDVIEVIGYHPDSDVGGGKFYWDSTKAKSDHNGGTVLSPTVPWSASIGDYLDGVGETDPEGSGCFVRNDVEYITPEMFGSLRDGSDDSASMNASIMSNTNTIFGRYSYRGTLSVNEKQNATIVIPDNCLIQSFSTNQVIQIINCTKVKVSGGNITTENRVTRPISILGSAKCTIKDTSVSFESKSTYTGAAIYGTAGIFLENSSLCTILNCEVFNIEGFGIATVGNGSRNTIDKNYLHDNVAGVLNNGDAQNFNAIVNNTIGFNNPSTGSGNDGILVNATDIDNSSSGHRINGNIIYNNGEHGMYIQCSNTDISNNVVYSNQVCGIKVAKCRRVSVSNNTIHSNHSNIQVQSGYDDILIEGNNCSLASGSFDLDFTWNTGLDPFGGKNVKVIGNYFKSNVATWSMDIDGTEGIYIENNTCAKGLIYSGNATGTYQNIRITNNTFEDGVVRIIKCENPLLLENKFVSLLCNDTNSDVVLKNNIITGLTIGTRKDVALNAFIEISGNNIASPDVGGSPNFEIFNGQDAINNNLIISSNYITTAGAFIFNVNTSGGINSGIVNGNVFDAAGSDTFVCTGNSDNNTFIGNVGLKGQIISTNSIGIGNTGGAAFSGTGSTYANNL